MDYLNACAGVTDSQWLDIFTDADDERTDFWSVAQVVPGELRREGDRLARRWIAGEAPKTSLECWFRRVVCRLPSERKGASEPWVVLMAMAHAWAGRAAPSPRNYAIKTNLPMAARAYARTVSIAREECPGVPRTETWLAACNG